MRVTYDRSANAVYICLRDKIPPGDSIGRAHFSTGISTGADRKASVILDFNLYGCPLGIEILGARDCLPPEFLAAAEDITDTENEKV
jgi:uncharacterized protein YuzE